MLETPTLLADRLRLLAFAEVGRFTEAMRSSALVIDPAGIGWRVIKAREIAIGFTWLGPGWAFDAEGRRGNLQEYEERHQRCIAASLKQHGQELGDVAGKLRIG